MLDIFICFFTIIKSSTRNVGRGRFSHGFFVAYEEGLSFTFRFSQLLILHWWRYIGSREGLPSLSRQMILKQFFCVSVLFEGCGFAKDNWIYVDHTNLGGLKLVGHPWIEWTHNDAVLFSAQSMTLSFFVLQLLLNIFALCLSMTTVAINSATLTDSKEVRRQGAKNLILVLGNCVKPVNVEHAVRVDCNQYRSSVCVD